MSFTDYSGASTVTANTFLYTLTTDNTSYSMPLTGQLALAPAPPKVLTEVEQLLSDVEKVCALAR